ncbi:MAG: acid sugar phosphatase [Candidatus Tectimicrobiota bacterium]|nr:MAG: acid sugar phosphatase [Candidatus Tectomicrobia bacterium]
MLRHVVMDMDGVIYRGEALLPGVRTLLQQLQQRGVQVAFLTNNASRHRQELAEKLKAMGLPCTLEQVWGSAYITARYLAREAPAARVFVVGTAGTVRELQEAGLTVVPTHEGATHVVVGLDWGLTYEKLRQAHYAICQGAHFIATNLDPTYPDSLHTTAPGGGAIVAALRTSTGVAPQVMGKPQPTGLALIAAAWGVRPSEMVAVGDRLDTDIAAARAFGCRAVLVLTGVTRRAEAEQAPAALRPDAVIADLTELVPLLERWGRDESGPLPETHKKVDPEG